MSEVILKAGTNVTFLGYAANVEEQYRCKGLEQGAALVITGEDDTEESPFYYHVAGVKGVTSPDGVDGGAFTVASDEFEVDVEEASSEKAPWTDEDQEKADKEEADAKKAEAAQAKKDKAAATKKAKDEAKAEKKKADVLEAAKAEAKKADAEKAAAEEAEAESNDDLEVEDEPVKKAPAKKVKTPAKKVEEKVEADVESEDLEDDSETEAVVEATKEVKLAAKEGEHIPSSEATTYIQDAQNIVEEGGAVQTILDMTRKAAFGAFVVGCAISDIHKNKRWIDDGYPDDIMKGFAQYCLDKFGMEYRTAIGRMTLFDEFSAMGESVVATLIEVGTTKATFIAAKMRSGEYEEDEVMGLLEVAKDGSMDEIKGAVMEIEATHEGDDGDEGHVPKEIWTNYNFRLPADKGGIVMDVLNGIIDQEGGSEEVSPDDALVLLCMQYSDLTSA